MTVCLNCEGSFTGSSTNAVCPSCMNRFDASMADYLDKVTSNYFEATFAGITPDGIIYLYSEDFTAYMPMTEDQEKQFRDFLVRKWGLPDE